MSNREHFFAQVYLYNLHIYYIHIVNCGRNRGENVSSLKGSGQDNGPDQRVTWRVCKKTLILSRNSDLNVEMLHTCVVQANDF